MQIADDSTFCNNCGVAIGVVAPASRIPTGSIPTQPVFVQMSVQQPGGIVCPRCGSTNTAVSVNTYAKSKHRSLLWNLFVICITSGFWLIWMLIRKRKEKIVTQKTAVCNTCTHGWSV